MNITSYRRNAGVLAACMAFVTLAIIASCKKDEDTHTSPPDELFSTVTIGSHAWMTENLNVVTYADGTPIPQVSDSIEWLYLTTGAWCWYQNDSATYASSYGRLYNWYAVAGIYDAASKANPALRKKLAPLGWHVPTDAEWSDMINSLDSTADGGSNFSNIAGGKMKTTGTIEDGDGLWFAPNEMASNSSGFSGAPVGMRDDYGGFLAVGYFGNWWSSSEVDSLNAWFRFLGKDDGSARRYYDLKNNGFSVRCIKD